MAVGPKLSKWTWMMDNVEVRGVVRLDGLPDGTELPMEEDDGNWKERDAFNLELDPNYRHMVALMRGNNPTVPAGGPSGSIHVEAYSHSFDDPAMINRAEPFALPDKPVNQKFEVRVDQAGNRRPLRVGDHVRLFGRWVIENQHENYCWTRKFGLAQLPDSLRLKVGCVWAELHPFHWQSVELVESLDPGKTVETLSLAAPVYEETYQRGAAVDPFKTVAGHAFITDDRSNYHHTMAANTHIKAPPPPAGSKPGDYKVAHSEQVLINGTGFPVSQVRAVEVQSDGIRVAAAVTAPPSVWAVGGEGGWIPQHVADVNDPAHGKSVFQARYTVWLAPNPAAFVSQNVPATMIAGQKYKVSVTMRNSGTKTWSPVGTQYHALGSQSPQDNQVWGLNRIKVASTVAPGGQTTFSFQVTAPSTPGTYDFQWRMVHEFVEWFGDYTPKVKVSVTPPQLSVGIEPYPVVMGRSRQYIVRAEDEGTHAPVAGTVKITNPGVPAKQFPTNTPFSFTFKAGLTRSGEELVIPHATVTAPGYAIAELDLGWSELDLGWR